MRPGDRVWVDCLIQKGLGDRAMYSILTSDGHRRFGLADKELVRKENGRKVESLSIFRIQGRVEGEVNKTATDQVLISFPDNAEYWVNLNSITQTTRGR